MGQIGDYDAAVHDLLRGGETDLAYAVASLTGPGNREYAVRRMAARCEALGLLQDTIDMLQDTRESAKEVGASVDVCNACIVACSEVFSHRCVLPYFCMFPIRLCRHVVRMQCALMLARQAETTEPSALERLYSEVRFSPAICRVGWP